MLLQSRRRARCHTALFPPPLSEPVLAPFRCTRLSSFSEFGGGHFASRVPQPLLSATPCCPSPCPRQYPGHSGTTDTPSPCASRRVGDPTVTRSQRAVRGGVPFVPLQPPHCRSFTRQSVPRPPTTGVSAGVTASGMLRWANGETTGDWDSPNPGFALRTGRAERRVPYLHAYPLSHHAAVPVGFPRWVSPLGTLGVLEVVCSRPHLHSKGCATRRSGARTRR